MIELNLYHLFAILGLCVGFINHLIDTTFLNFGYPGDVVRFLAALLGYTIFIILWYIGNKYGEK